MSNIDFKIENSVGIIILNRPDKFNSFVREMAFDLQARLDECESNNEVRSIEEVKEIFDFIEKSNKRGLVTL